MVEVRQGEIWLYEPPKVTCGPAPSPLIATSGSEQSGMRPWIIVSRDLINKGRSTAIGVPLSTKVEKANSYRIALPPGELIAEVGRDPFKPSVALCDHVRVLDLNLVRKRIGRVF
jgi:mRNA-degrading endonuclease toxin of MazEF toxin-antitoxin module